jgi:nitroreductase
MFFDFPVQETIQKRRSVRTFNGEPLSEKDLESLKSYADAIRNPFGIPVSVHVLETADNSQRKLGTYGVIKGTTTFLGVTVEKGPLSLEAVGYNFEQLVLYATYLGIGTCWLAATFDRKAFTNALNVGDDERMPVISPVGYPAKKVAMSETLMRAGMKSNQRKDLNALFFNGNFRTPLSRSDAGKYAEALEMLRLAPSATNAQPWRILFKDGIFHFYAKVSEGQGEVDPPIIQRVDTGICANHFCLTAQERGLSGTLTALKTPPDSDAPENYRYLFTWMEK